MPTPGSNAGLMSAPPMPRSETASDGPNEAPCGFSDTFGVASATCARLVWLLASIVSAFTAVMASGVSWMYCARNCAVTTISLLSAAASYEAPLAGPAIVVDAVVESFWASAGVWSAMAARDAHIMKGARADRRRERLAMETSPIVYNRQSGRLHCM